MTIKNYLCRHHKLYDHDDEIGDMLNCYRGHEKKKLYAWIFSDGTLVHVGEDPVAALKIHKEMQDKANTTKKNLYLTEMFCDRTLVVLCPPMKERFIKGGHAMGGSAPQNIEAAALELRKFINKQYKNASEVTFKIESNTVTAEHGNVRCWIVFDKESQEKDESNYPLRWSAYVSMINNWNFEYHDVLVGMYPCGIQAVCEAFLAFMCFQLEEQLVDEI